MHQKPFGGRALPGPTGGAYSAPQTPGLKGLGPGRGEERRSLRGMEKGEEGKGGRKGGERKVGRAGRWMGGNAEKGKRKRGGRRKSKGMTKRGWFLPRLK